MLKTFEFKDVVVTQTVTYETIVVQAMSESDALHRLEDIEWQSSSTPIIESVAYEDHFDCLEIE